MRIGVEMPGVSSTKPYLTKDGGPGSDRYDDARGRVGAWDSDNRVRTILCRRLFSGRLVAFPGIDIMMVRSHEV